MKRQGKTLITCDVLVVGGGFGGFWAAIRAREKVERVILVDRCFAGKSGHSRFACGEMVVFLPGDNLDLWGRDIAQANDWIADQEEIEKILLGTQDRLTDFESFGVDFPKIKGNYARFASRGTQHVQAVRLPAGGGAKLMLTLRKQALYQGVEIYDHTFISHFLKDAHEGVGGAIGISTRTGELYVFQAGAIVVATNSGGFRGHHLASDQQGTGVFLAYKAGATLKNAEFHFINIRPTRFEIEGSGIFPVFGGKYVNAKDEAFMRKYDPEFQDRASNHRIIVAMAQEVKEGRGPIFLDTPSMSVEGREQFRVNWVSHGWMALLHSKVKREFRDFLTEKVEWQPAYESNRTGIVTDARCAAEGVHGLYVAGMAKSFDPVALTGWSIARCIWSGYTAGYYASHHSLNAARSRLNKHEIDACIESLFLPVRRKKGISPDRVDLKIQKALFSKDTLIVQSEGKLKEALHKIEEIKRRDVVSLRARDLHELVKVKETETMVLGAQMALRAALMRKETRPNIFYREDYPLTDNHEWLQWILVKKEEEGMELTTRPIPFDRYKFKPAGIA